MINSILIKIFGDPSDKKVKIYTNQIEKIKESEKKFEKLNLTQIKEKTAEFKLMFIWLDFRKDEDLVKIKNILDEIKYDAFAIVKITTKLINGQKFELKDWKEVEWNMVPYDVQLVWGLAIHEGNIWEMKTWEWKTLVATLPAYLNALTWNSIHIVTVNDYLAERDSEEMGILYNALWLTVGFVNHDQSKIIKKEAYRKDVVYATNNELWFDYLRDNMVTKKEDKMQSKLYFAIIDEVDSILIDEARTPLIISMPDNEPTSKYGKFAAIAKMLESGKDYKIDEKQKTASLSEEWIEKIEKLLKVDNIYISDHYNDLHHIENSIKAEWVYLKDKDYIINNWEAMIVDEHTWRVLSGRRYSDGLHQAIEAKEWIEIQQESKTLASITFQNYFRMYSKLSWMTGTAKTEEEEFYKVYGLETLTIPTNMPTAREDRPDLLFKNEKGKFEYIVKYIKEINETGRPILVWTVSVDKSEYLGSLLTKAWITNEVLNAKHNEREAEIIAKAGQKSSVTIATNMAWRGTDIKLGEWVAKLWGLFIIGTEKHETRRIDNQLRWRAWRQWDAWTTQFLVSPADDIMRIFGWDKMFSLFNSSFFSSLPDDEPLPWANSMLTKKITSVQKQVEWHNFDARKHVLEYDDVMNKHREIIYSKRDKIIDSENIDEDIKKMISSQVKQFVISEIIKKTNISKQDLVKKVNHFLEVEAIDTKQEVEQIEKHINDPEAEADFISNIALEEFEKIKGKAVSSEEFYDLERRIVLSSIDELWMRHIDSMSKLREEVAFEWYAQRQPLVVYKEKAFVKFTDLLWELEHKVTKIIFGLDKQEPWVNIKIEEKNILDDLMQNIDNWNIDNNNPLFAKPIQSQNRRPKSKKQKIRI